MTERIIVAGSGGQGVITAGKLLAQAGMLSGREVTSFPCYGAEVRGGTAYCNVVVSDEAIYSPVVEEATSLLIMNQPSFDRFSPLLAAGGLAFVNSTMVDADGPAVFPVPAGDVAAQLGNPVVANVVMLGALNERLGLFDPDVLLGCVVDAVGAKRPYLVEVNSRAFERGREEARRRLDPQTAG